MSGNLVLVSLAGGIGSCVGMALLLYNLVAAVLFLRESTQGTSSGLAKATWALGLLSMFLWFVPCVGTAAALAALASSRVERGRIYRDESSLAGATPIRMGSIDAGVSLLLQGLLAASAVLSLIAG